MQKARIWNFSLELTFKKLPLVKFSGSIKQDAHEKGSFPTTDASEAIYVVFFI